MRTLSLSNDAAGFLTSLEAKQSRQLWNKIVALMKDPRTNDSIGIGDNCFRTSVGEFRIVYRFDSTCVYVTLVGKRNDDEVYKRLHRT